ncbi:MAG: RNA polymerase sigma factor [Chroococcales cyanobacterium]
MTSAVERLTHSICLNPDEQKKQKDSAFWQQWQQYQDYLYRCCIKWTSNPIDAEDVLSQAMLKALQKIREGEGAIKNFKAWLTQLTYNLCVDLHRKRHQSTGGLESLDAIAPGDHEEWASHEETPLVAATQQELEEFLRDAIGCLPTRLREPFILYWEKEQSYRDIAAALNISYDNVRKRISQARKILRQQLNEYEGQDSSPSAQSVKRGKAKQAASIAPVKTEKFSFSCDSEEVRIVATEKPQEAALFV